MSSAEILEYYRRNGPMTDPGDEAAALARLPGDIGGIARAAHGIYIHEHTAGAYGESISESRRAEVHLRGNGERLACVLAHDIRALTEERPAADRMVANCRHYSTFGVAALRAHGVPARARCGFGAYFEPGKYIDHWVVERWDAAGGRWLLADAQLDEVQQKLFGIDFDVLDVPRDRFLVAGDAWRQCRAGKKDAADFGILDMAGEWFIAGNLVRDVAALNNVEMLPWDAWGAMAQPGEEMGEERLALLDRLAAMTMDPDVNFGALREAYAGEALRVPPVVFNAVRNALEHVIQLQG